MCFSAEASFGAAAVLALVGIATFFKVHKVKSLPFASIPLIFAFQQLLEGFIWVYRDTPDSFLYQLGLYGFLFMAVLFWPVWLPGSIYALETNKAIKKLLGGVGILGLLLSSFYILSVEEVKSMITGHHISYVARFTLFGLINEKLMGLILLISYTAIVCIPCFLSTVRGMWVMGTVLLLGWGITYVFYKVAFLSVWCFFSALASVVIYFIMKKYREESA